MGTVFTLYDETKAEKLERRPSRTDGPESPAVTQDSLVTPSTTRVAGFQTLTSGLRRVI
jgi:hypothetical protein